ncbi:MAG TPA: four helix bundle protein [Pyrinomonadaceae bacterium]|nr:four helix bundle protein [Pyrinomonadaceae bacterium]
MSDVGNNRDLIVWQKSIVLVKQVYALTSKFPSDE